MISDVTSLFQVKSRMAHPIGGYSLMWLFVNQSLRIAPIDGNPLLSIGMDYFRPVNMEPKHGNIQQDPNMAIGKWSFRLPDLHGRWRMRFHSIRYFTQ